MIKEVIRRNDDLGLEVVQTDRGFEVRHAGATVHTNHNRASALYVYNSYVRVLTFAMLVGRESVGWNEVERKMFLDELGKYLGWDKVL